MAAQDEGLTGDVQGAANQVVDGAQKIANSAVDLGEEGLRTALNAVVTANEMIGSALKAIAGKLS